ncbi:hypothetical protein NPX13_g7083 [Xylaria arbuscula]|uniref:WW domain-containing protein n=1 Tax=Xylaria arbuscula TaxID=114810 RepID=A0A9W8TJI8_9PEZI|nr:hypothetical protein NPX13_g7083 [Xylaria arbuscula]
MASLYRYQSLRDGSNEIRLIELLPGDFHEEIAIKMSHACLTNRADEPKRKFDLEHLKSGLPENWGVDMARSGRPIFYRYDPEIDRCLESSWFPPGDNSNATVPSESSVSRAAQFQPLYEALSYEWGSPDGVEEVYMEEAGLSHGRGQIEIRSNLASALRHLRHSDRARTLWVDALCINQADVNERNEQVKRMAEIFQSAERVLIWLGPEADDSRIAMQTLAHLGQQIEITSDNRAIPAPSSQFPQWRHQDQPLPYSSQEWSAINALFNRGWFERLWVVQESQLARDESLVCCGKHSMPLPLLQKAVACLHAKTHIPSAVRISVSRARILTLSLRDRSFHDIIGECQDLRCDDARDKVYGVLALPTPNLRLKIPIDYGLRVGDVYKAMVQTHADHVRRLEFLPYCGLGRGPSTERHGQLPSWVPDLTVHDPRWLFYHQFASGYARAHCIASPSSPDTLQALGVLCSRVQTLDDPVVSFNLEDVLRVVRSWEPENLSTQSYITGDSLLDVYAATLCAGQLQERFPTHSRLPFLRDWKQQNSANPLFGPWAKAKTWRPYELTQIEHASLEYLMGRRLMKTDECRIGLVPVDTEPGCASPMVLRKQSSGTFKVIGECFVYDLRDASSLLGPLPSPWTVNIGRDQKGSDRVYFFYNPDTETSTCEDPRLGPLVDWERIQHEWTPDDPEICDFFRHKTTGEVMNSDPRMLPDALRARGVNIETFSLPVVEVKREEPTRFDTELQDDAIAAELLRPRKRPTTGSPPPPDEDGQRKRH